MMAGAFGQCCCWLAITLLLNSASKVGLLSGRQQQLASAAVFFFFLFNFFFGASWQGVSWLYPTEINSTQHRIVGMSYGVATNWLINFGVVFVTPLGIAKLGSQFYAIWTVLNFLMVPIIYVFYPETAGRSLEDIDGMFEAHPSLFVFTSASMTSRTPSTSLDSPYSGDDVPNTQTEGHVKTFSRNVSAIELAPLANLRHRQPGGAAVPLGNMTPLQKDTALGKDETVVDNAAVSAEEARRRVEAMEDDEDADIISLQLAQGSTVLSEQRSNLTSHMSSRPLL